MPTTARHKPAEPRKPRAATETHGRNRAAVEASLPHLATGPEHSALIEVVRSLADVIDSDLANDRLWRQYQQAVDKLMEATGGGSSDDFAERMAQLRAPILDPSKP
jgi:hypothetical protein